MAKLSNNITESSFKKEEKKFIDYGNNVRSLFLGAEAGRVYYREFTSNKIQVLPGVETDDTYAVYLTSLYTELVSLFKDAPLRNGWFTSPIQIEQFSKLKTMPGSIRPLNYGSATDITNCSAKKSISDKFASCIERVVKARYGIPIEDHDVIISRDSSSGAPFFRKDAEFKIDHLGIISSNLTALEMLDLERLWKEQNVLFLSNAQVRLQSDKWKGDTPKPRNYSGYVDAHLYGPSLNRSNPYSVGELTRDYGGVRLGTCRTRVVRAFPSAVNYIITSFLVDYRDSADGYYAFTYKHRGPEDILAKVKDAKYCLGIDVSQYDSNITYEMFKVWLSALPINGVKKDIIDLFSRSPFYTSEVRMCDGDPLDKSTFKYWAGLPSGVAYTSMIGKDIMTSVVLYAIEMSTNQEYSIERIAEFLKGKLEIKLLNQSDDSVLMTEDESLMKDIFGYMNDIFEIVPEDGLTFLGNLGYIDGNGHKQLCPNLVSYFEKIYVPERSINTKFRPYPIFGIKERRQYYSKHPYFNQAREVEREVFKQVYGTDLDLLENMYYKAPPKISSLEPLSEADIDVLNNPERLWYKYDLSTINKNVVNLFMSRLPREYKARFNAIGEKNGR